MPVTAILNACTAQRNKDSFRGSTALLNKPLTAQGCSDIFSVISKPINKQRIIKEG